MEKLTKITHQPHEVKKWMVNNYPPEQAGKNWARYMKTIESDPLKYFCPNLMQEKIINEFNACVQERKISINLFTCGTQMGKTLVSGNVVGNLVYGIQNEWFNLEIFKNWPFPKRIWLITTPSNLKETYFKEGSKSSFYHLFRAHKWKPIKRNKPWYSEIEFKGTEWDMSIYSYNQPLSEFESAQVGVILLDEPTQQTIWEKLPSRLSAGGTYLMPQTPEDIDAYVVKDIVNPAKAGEKGIRHIELSTTEVTTDKPRGHYDPDVLKEQIKIFQKTSQDLVDIRVHGKILYFKERIIEGINESIHFVDPSDYPLRSDYLYYHVFDPHAARPNAEIWGAVTPEGRRIIFAERPFDQSQDFWDMTGSETYQDHKMNVEFFEEQLRRIHNINFVFERVIDRHYAKQQRVPTEQSTIKEYQKIGWNLRESYTAQDERNFGHLKIMQLLKILPDGKPGMVIYKNCYHAQNALTTAIRRLPKTESERLKPAGSGQIVEKYYCFISTIRYFVCHPIFSQDAGVKNKYEYLKSYKDGYL